MTSHSAEGRTIGVRGHRWRARVDRAGALHPADGGAVLRWAVAADDGWHDPRSAASVRQRWLAGTPVSETRLRVPGGEFVARSFCTADHGGMAVIEFENESTLPVVVALSRGDVMSSVPLSTTEPKGIDFPSDSVVVPVGHRGTSRVALGHAHPGRGPLPNDVARADAIVRGWETATDKASRLQTPDPEGTVQVRELRCRILLADVETLTFDELIELGRMETLTDESLLEVVLGAEKILRRQRRASRLAWNTRHALAEVARLCRLHEDDVAAEDVAAGWLRLSDRPVDPLPTVAPTDARSVAWHESCLVAADPGGGRCTLFPAGVPREWWGAPCDFHGLTADPLHTVSAALRWHGDRPALLWEVDGPSGIVIDGGGFASSWCSTDPRGETLWPAPIEIT